jgi:hypothetical protein
MPNFSKIVLQLVLLYALTKKVNKRRRGHSLPAVSLVKLEVGDDFSAMGDRVRADRMTRDDVMIAQGLYRPGVVTQPDVAGIIHLDHSL